MNTYLIISVAVEVAFKKKKAFTIQVVVSFVSPSRSSIFLVVNCVSGTIWEIPIDLIGTEPLMDHVLIIESSEVGKTSAVGFHLTSTTRCVCVCVPCYYF